MSKNTKWVILWLQNCWQRQRNEIFVKEFDSELDMLVWASKNAIPKGHRLHHVACPQGMSKLPNDLYERIDALRHELVEKEHEVEKQEELSERDKRVKIAERTNKARKTRQERQEAQCITQ